MTPQSPDRLVEHLDIGNGFAVVCGGRWHGWLMQRHPDGQFVSVRKLEQAANPYGHLAELATRPSPAPQERAAGEVADAALAWANAAYAHGFDVTSREAASAVDAAHAAFTAALQAAERGAVERCAKVAEDHAVGWAKFGDNDGETGRISALEIASAIRALPQHDGGGNEDFNMKGENRE